jgi:hypothetical protein
MEQRQMVEPHENRATIFLLDCDPEEGGCGRKFVAEVTMEVTFRIVTGQVDLPSNRGEDALAELKALVEPGPDIVF